MIIRLDTKQYKESTTDRPEKADSGGTARTLESYLSHFPDASDRDRVEQILKKLGRPVK